MSLADIAAFSSSRLWIFLLVLASIFLFLWVIYLMKRLTSIVVLAIARCNGTIARVPELSRDEVSIGLTPSRYDTRHLLRQQKEKKNPARRVFPSTAPAVLHKRSITLHMNGELVGPENEESRNILVSCGFQLDCGGPVEMSLFWNVVKEDVFRFYSNEEEENNEEEAAKHYTKLLSHKTSKSTVSPSIGIEMIQKKELKSSLQSPVVQIGEGLNQSFLLEESASITLQELYKTILDPESTHYPLLVHISSESTTQSQYIGIIDFSVVKDDEERITDIVPYLKDQYLVVDQEMKKLSELFGADEEDCVICLTEVKDTTILPCNHFCVCKDCFKMVDTCPICRTTITGFVRFLTNQEEPDSPLSSSTGEAEIEVLL